MKQVIPLFTLMLTCFLVSAQYEYFDLSKYKLPDIKRHQLDFQFKTTGYNQSNEYYNLNDFVDGKRIETDSKNKKKYIAGYGEFNYSYYRNTSRFQTNANVETSYRYMGTDNSVDYVTDQDYEDIRGVLVADYDLKFYPGSRNWFLSIKPRTYLNFSKQKNYLKDIHYQDGTFNNILGLGGGKGRIEKVQDFRHAILLLQEIDKRGVTNGTLSEREINELSQLISEIKNKRFFDSRRKKETDLIAVDSFLISKGVVDDNKSIAYFTGLEDMWEYGGLHIRESGSQLNLMVTSGYTTASSRINDESRLEELTLNTSLNYIFRKPISIKWQFDFNSGIYYTYTDKIVEKYMSSSSTKNLTSAYTDLDFGYYPNTRTSFHFWWGSGLSNRSDKTLLDDRNYRFQSQSGTSAYYYISERLRLEGTISYNNDIYGIFNSNLENAHHNFFNYTLTFNYAIF